MIQQSQHTPRQIFTYKDATAFMLSTAGSLGHKVLLDNCTHDAAALARKAFAALPDSIFETHPGTASLIRRWARLYYVQAVHERQQQFAAQQFAALEPKII